MPKKYLHIQGAATYIQHTGVSTLPNRPPVLDYGEAVVCLHGVGGHGQFFVGDMGDLVGALQDGRCEAVAWTENEWKSQR